MRYMRICPFTQGCPVGLQKKTAIYLFATPRIFFGFPPNLVTFPKILLEMI